MKTEATTSPAYTPAYGAHTHMDALCHFFYNGKAYNNFAHSAITEKGAPRNSVINFKGGVITRGLLMDIPRLKGVDYLEPARTSIRKTCMPGNGKLA